jgi:hypothetical protein
MTGGAGELPVGDAFDAATDGEREFLRKEGILHERRYLYEKNKEQERYGV